MSDKKLSDIGCLKKMWKGSLFIVAQFILIIVLILCVAIGYIAIISLVKEVYLQGPLFGVLWWFIITNHAIFKKISKCC